jgi:hypothetical protein
VCACLVRIASTGRGQSPHEPETGRRPRSGVAVGLGPVEGVSELEMDLEVGVADPVAALDAALDDRLTALARREVERAGDLLARLPDVGSRDASEAFKSRRDEATRMQDMESIVLDQDEEALAPAVVVATIALVGVFVLGFLIQIVGLVV